MKSVAKMGHIHIYIVGRYYYLFYNSYNNLINWFLLPLDVHSIINLYYFKVYPLNSHFSNTVGHIECFCCQLQDIIYVINKKKIPQIWMIKLFCVCIFCASFVCNENKNCYTKSQMWQPLYQNIHHLHHPNVNNCDFLFAHLMSFV